MPVTYTFAQILRARRQDRRAMMRMNLNSANANDRRGYADMSAREYKLTAELRKNRALFHALARAESTDERRARLRTNPVLRPESPTAAFLRVAQEEGFDYRAAICGHYEYSSEAFHVYYMDRYDGLRSRGLVCHKCAADLKRYEPALDIANAVVEAGAAFSRVSGPLTLVTGYKQVRTLGPAESGVLVNGGSAGGSWVYKGKPMAGEMQIRGYHAARGAGYMKLGAQPGELTFGVEVETNVVDFENQRQRRATELLVDFPDRLDVEFDGSVSNGFEIVTGYGGYEQIRALLSSLYKGHVSDYARYRFSGGTGAHIHIGRAGHRLDLGNAVAAFEFVARFPTLIQLVAGRQMGRYCRPIPLTSSQMRDLSRILETLREDRDGALMNRYLAMNIGRLVDGRTVEWRSPRGTGSYPTMLGRLQFIRSLMMCSMHSTDPITAEALVDFIMAQPREETAALRRLLHTNVIRTQLAAHVANPYHDSCAPFATLPYNGRAEFTYCQPI